MSLDYMTFFEPVPLSRGEILRRIIPVLDAYGLRYDGPSSVLTWHAELQEFIEERSDLQLSSIGEAIEASASEIGISAGFVGPRGISSIFLWRDRTTDHEVLHLWEDSSRFLHHTGDEDRWRGYEDYLLELAGRIGASFVVCGIATPRDTLHVDDLSRVLQEIGNRGTDQQFVLAMIHSRLMPPDELAGIVAHRCRFAVRSSYSIIVDPFYGPRGEED